MEFNNENLEQHFDSIKEIVSKCDFVALDTELTGLSKCRNVFYDTPEMRYKDAKDNSMEYAVTQLGICTFNFNPTEQCFEYCPMNFLLKRHSNDLENSNFLINSATIEFLNKSQFDYNDIFRNGIFFISHNEFERRKSLIEIERQHSLSHLDFDNDIFDFTHLNDLIRKCEEFLLNDDMKEMKLDTFSTSYDKYLILNELWKKIGCINGKWILTELDKSQGQKYHNSIIVRKSDNAIADIQASINENFDKKQSSLKNLLRVADIVKCISDSKIPIIAHNSFLDILHLVNKFFEPLPESYTLFKTLIDKLFPRIYDTKFIFNDDAFKNFKMSNLQGIYEITKIHYNNTVVKPLNDEYDFSSENSFHTAHYDAMITGKIFISLFSELNKKTENFWTHFLTDVPNSVLKYLNKIKVVNVEFGHFNLNFGPSDKKSNRKNVFQMTFPNYWKKHDITLYLSEFLNKSYKDVFQNVEIRWIDSKSLTFKLPNSYSNEVPIPHESDDGTVNIVSFYKYFNVVDPDLPEIDEDGFQKVKKRKYCKSKDK